MAERRYYGSLSPEPTELELANRALSRRAAAEGFVLLKNEGGALPLASKKIALYGTGARMTVKGGLGSGSLENRYNVTIEEGLKNAGYEITSAAWLDDYDRGYAQAYQTWHDFVEEQVKGLTDMPSIIVKAHSYVFQAPVGRGVTEEDVAASDTDTAIYVLTRQAGEGNDRRLEKGDYLITDLEREILTVLGKSYAHTIVVINVGGLVEMSFLDEIEGIDAVVMFVQGGEEGGNALADVLSGKVNFSGKLAVTIPVKYEDIPFGDKFSYLGGDLNNSYYTEGIYVGYRYYDSFGVPVRYPFGYGLSYTTYSLAAGMVSAEGAKVSADVTVTNTGGCAGKEVVQLYVSVPAGAADKEFQRLVAFAKTDELTPGASQTLTLTFSAEDLASYDEEKAAWILDAGDYILRVGDSSRSTAPAAVLRLSDTITTVQCHHCAVPTDDLPEFRPSEETAAAVRAAAPGRDVPVVTIDPSAIPTRVVDYTEPVFEETKEEAAILDSLTIEEQAQLLRGGDLQRPPKGTFEIQGAAGKTSTALLEKGIPNVIYSDGPAGISIVSEVLAMEDGSFSPAKVPERYNWGMAAKGMKAYFARLQGTKVYRYATAWPVAMLQAQTWNTPLMEEIGDAAGKEMEAFGVSVWLAPGMNIQKNTLGGRTFEYYSEDPVVSGRMAAALTKGVQKHPGCGVSIKHFCCNNIEDNRLDMSANVSERALREIYLKGFEIAVKSAAPMTVMSSYNMVNHTYTPNSHDLLTDILRCEWGFEGMVMSDWGSCDPGHGNPALGAPAGNDMIMPGSVTDYEAILAAIRAGGITPRQVRTSAGRALRLIMNAHTYGKKK